jgi:hypothetical protein
MVSLSALSKRIVGLSSCLGLNDLSREGSRDFFELDRGTGDADELESRPRGSASFALLLESLDPSEALTRPALFECDSVGGDVDIYRKTLARGRAAIEAGENCVFVPVFCKKTLRCASHSDYDPVQSNSSSFAKQ